MRALKDIPNQSGYRLVGITLDQERVPCIVGINPLGCHSVYRERDLEPFWFQLVGWEPTEPPIHSTEQETKR